MEYKELFTSPERTLELINIQANAPENIAFAKKYFPKFTSAADIWNAVKPITKFQADPRTIDTIQGISTLFNTSKNIHGVSGFGDCDCFTSALASIAIANNLPFKYIIQGNNKPSHIAIKIGNTILDLTNPVPDYLREYKFTKYIKPMFVALADNEELATELNDFGRPRILKRVMSTAARYAPKPVTGFVNRKLNQVNQGAARGFNRLPPAARAKILLGKRQLKRMGYGDSEAALMSIQNFSDDFGRPKISLKRGLQNVGRAGAAVGKVALKAAPILLPVAGAALNFVAPGVGSKVAGVAAKGLQKIGGTKTLTAARGLVQTFRPAPGTPAPAQNFTPATLPGMPSAGMQATKQIMSEPVFAPDTYVTPAVPISAPKINPLLLVGAGALALIFLTRKK
jgi:hypothetical protein